MSDYNPGQFLKCPNCHRTNTVELTLHIDGDASLHCAACDAHASAFKLHEHDRTYRANTVQSK